MVVTFWVRFNEKTTRQFKEISTVLNDAIFCMTKTKSLVEIVGEDSKVIREEYRVVLSKVLAKIMDLRNQNLKDMLERDNIIKKKEEELKKKQEENQRLEQIIYQGQETLKEEYRNQISRQNNQVFFIFFSWIYTFSL